MIEKLKPEVINKIAAGEVVERPAHLIKELVENSIDAGATEVFISVDKELTSLKIEDNGHGMSVGDLNICLEPHSTSKLKEFKDVWNLSSFGFRGEALSSIGSVCNLTITSCEKDSSQAYCLKSEYGLTSKPQKASRREGTTILVEKLFENTPARKKFLKTSQTERQKLVSVLEKMAISHPEVEFKYSVDAKLVKYWPQSDIKKRIENVLGLRDLYEVSDEVEGYSIKAYLCPPHKTAKRKNKLLTYVQNRWVENSTLYGALYESYRSLLMHGEHPQGVLFVDAEPHFVDVNVHPQKSQVRFTHESVLFKLIKRTIKELWITAPWIPEADVSSDRAEYTKPQASQRFLELKNQIQHLGESSSQLSGEQKSSFGRLSDGITEEVRKDFGSKETQSHLFQKTEALQFKKLNEMYASGGAAKSDLKQEGLEKTPSSKWAQLYVLGQLHNTYLICQSKESMVLVDQHAAQERVLFEKLWKQWRAGQFSIQKLLIPISLNFSESDTLVLVESSDVIQSMGIEIEQVGPNSLQILSLPSVIKDAAVEPLLIQFVQQKKEQSVSFKLEQHLDDLFASMACHSSVRAGQTLSLQQMKDLLAQMDEDKSSFCPHGRPVFVEYELSSIEKSFGRIV